MPLLSNVARRGKARYFLDPLPKQARILEIGCGGGWVGTYLKSGGWQDYIGLDVSPPADLVGDIRDWRSLGLKEGSFDAIVAFEVVEHVDCWQECHTLLKPGGQLLATSPVPHMDWLMNALEAVGLNQKRGSPHDHLVYFEEVPLFSKRKLRRVAGLSQWGIFIK